jgi:hypothetical protein
LLQAGEWKLGEIDGHMAPSLVRADPMQRHLAELLDQRPKL